MPLNWGLTLELAGHDPNFKMIVAARGINNGYIAASKGSSNSIFYCIGRHKPKLLANRARTKNSFLFDVMCYKGFSMNLTNLTPAYFTPADAEHVGREKAKARELRNSQWWRNQLGAGVCHYCSQKFAKLDLTMDHVIPIIRGGKSTKSNVVVCCKKCNSEKKYLTPFELAAQKLEAT